MRVTPEEWAEATPVFSQLKSAADISYQPEFHPQYDEAFAFLSEPTKLAALAKLEEKAQLDAERDAERLRKEEQLEQERAEQKKSKRHKSST